MRVMSLQSGSNGNCIYVEAGEVRLLLDAGISGRQAQLRLAGAGRDIRDCHALLISHDHSDHARGAGIFHRKFALPVYVTEPTLAAAQRRQKLGQIDDVRHFRSGEVLRFGHVRVETVRTPHDGVDGVGFVLDDGRARLGVLTDLGHVFDGLDDILAGLDAVLLESNYDPDLLEQCWYPWAVKQRISGWGGHLANAESAELLARSGRRLRWACLAHLSADTNHPRLALETHAEVLGGALPLHVAGRHAPTAMLEI